MFEIKLANGQFPRSDSREDGRCTISHEFYYAVDIFSPSTEQNLLLHSLLLSYLVSRGRRGKKKDFRLVFSPLGVCES